MFGTHANFSIVEDTPQRLVLRDNGPWDQHPTITNDAEFVVESVAEQLGDRRLLYFDSEGDFAILIVKNGRFAGFAPVPAF
jgi:hypothetical protein